eukprot:scaffold7397_cov277-Pinguiococcus_pyrenoidosus.AAC.1
MPLQLQSISVGAGVGAGVSETAASVPLFSCCVFSTSLVRQSPLHRSSHWAQGLSGMLAVNHAPTSAQVST